MPQILQKILKVSCALMIYSATAAAQTGSVSGTVVSNSGENITSALVDLVEAISPRTLAGQALLSNGTYTINNVADGTYYVRTRNARALGENYVDEVYNNVQCEPNNCPFDKATPIKVTNGAAVTAINFTLAKGGKITGRISDGMSPLPGITQPFLYNSSGDFIAAGGADQGDYTFTGLPTGTYYIGTVNNAGYVAQFYNNVTCPGRNCLPIESTPIMVTEEQTTENINFVLALGGRISGTVTNAFTGGTLTGAKILVLSLDGSTVGSDELGLDEDTFITEGIPPGTYYVKTSGTASITELFDDIACQADCTITEGTPVSVSTGQTTTVNVVLASLDESNLPDLIGNFTGVPNTDKASRPTLTVQNRGVIGSPSFAVTINQSPTRSLGRNVKVLKTQNIPALAKGSKAKVTFKLKADPKRPYLIAVVDADKEVAEKVERNNRTVQRIP